MLLKIHRALAITLALLHPLSMTMAHPNNPFGQLPANAASDIEPYQLHVPDSDVKNMTDLLKLSPVAAPIWENALPDGGRSLGLRREWLLEAKRAWETGFNWHVSPDVVLPFMKRSNVSTGGRRKVVLIHIRISRSQWMMCLEHSMFTSWACFLADQMPCP